MVAGIALASLALAGCIGTGESSSRVDSEPNEYEDSTILLILDEDAIDNGTETIEEISFGSVQCGGGDPAVCVNDDLADPNVREILFTRGNNVTPLAGLELPTGQEGDPGLFTFTRPDPQISMQNGATFTMGEYVAGIGVAADENNLDKVADARSLGEGEIYALVGKTVCAVVYDSDVSEVEEGANLMGATLGLTGFTVVDAFAAVGDSSSSFPHIVVDLLDAPDVVEACTGAGGSECPPDVDTGDCVPGDGGDGGSGDDGDDDNGDDGDDDNGDGGEGDPTDTNGTGDEAVDEGTGGNCIPDVDTGKCEPDGGGSGSGGVE